MNKIKIKFITAKNSCIIQYRNLNTKDEKNILIKAKTAKTKYMNVLFTSDLVLMQRCYY